MGAYTTKMIEDKDVKDIITLIERGYIHDGVYHRPNKQVATILLLQANLGCRINDIVHLTVENFVYDGDIWKLDLIEQKTGKVRNFIVPKDVKNIVDNWCDEKDILHGRLFKITAQAVWKALRPCVDYLGYKNVSCHSLRKAAGMRTYLSSGKDIALVTQFYNHSSPAVSMKYLQRTSKQMDEALSKATLVF